VGTSAGGSSSGRFEWGIEVGKEYLPSSVAKRIVGSAVGVEAAIVLIGDGW